MVHTPTDPEANEALARFQAIPENLELLGELLALRADFLGFASKASNLVEIASRTELLPDDWSPQTMICGRET